MLVVLLPPSEGKVRGGAEPGWDPASGGFPGLVRHRRRVATALKRARGGTEKLLGARGDLLRAAREANRALVGAPTLPAHERFTGVVWEHLDPSSLGARGRRRAEAGVVVVSAVAGLSRWNDPLPDFRLKLSVRIDPLGNLATFWRAALSDALNDFATGHTVVDLLPNEHRAAWEPAPGRYRLVRPEFATADGRVAGHAGKAAKGRFARRLLDTGRLPADDAVTVDGIEISWR